MEDLGGASTHASKSGVAHVVAPDEQAVLADVRAFLSYLPQNNGEQPPLHAEHCEQAEQPVQQLPTPVQMVSGWQLSPLSEATTQPGTAAPCPPARGAKALARLVFSRRSMSTTRSTRRSFLGMVTPSTRTGETGMQYVGAAGGFTGTASRLGNYLVTSRIRTTRT